MLGQSFPAQKESYPSGKLPQTLAHFPSHRGRDRQRSGLFGSLHAWAICRCREIKIDSQSSFALVIKCGTQILLSLIIYISCYIKGTSISRFFFAPESRLINQPNYQENSMKEISEYMVIFYVINIKTKPSVTIPRSSFSHYSSGMSQKRELQAVNQLCSPVLICLLQNWIVNSPSLALL